LTVKANRKVSEEKEGVMGSGLRKGLTSYGDAGFSLFLRKAFIKAMGYSEDALDRPIVGITNTYSDYNPCHGNVPTLIEAVRVPPTEESSRCCSYIQQRGGRPIR
jgi:Dihydroxyacid dehydratase/phosphogluconate dehydratase